VKKIADTGLLKALLDRSDSFHHWGHEQFRIHAPFYTCETVLDELAFLLGDASLGLKLVSRRDLILDFALSDHVPEILRLLDRYADQPMDLADACLVRMSELVENCKIWTVDEKDFRVYRRNVRQLIPCEFP
jgi:predicted nucleic acid-binding protein